MYLKCKYLENKNSDILCQITFFFSKNNQHLLWQI